MSRRKAKLLKKLIKEQNQELGKGVMQRNQWTRKGMANYSASRKAEKDRIAEENARYDASQKANS